MYGKTPREIWLEERVKYLEELLDVSTKFYGRDDPYPSRFFRSSVRYTYETIARCAADIDENGLFVMLSEEKNQGSMDQLGLRYTVARSNLFSTEYNIENVLLDMHERLIYDLTKKIYGDARLAGS